MSVSEEIKPLLVAFALAATVGGVAAIPDGMLVLGNILAQDNCGQNRNWNPAEKAEQQPKAGSKDVSPVTGRQSAPEAKRSCRDYDWYDLFGTAVSWAIDRTLSFWQTVFDFFLVFIGFFQGLIYLGMRNDSRASQRAFVFVNKVNHSWHHNASNEREIVSWSFAPHIENTGNTPTRNMITYTCWRAFRDASEFRNFDFPDYGVDYSSGLLGPKQSLDSSSVEIPYYMLEASRLNLVRTFIWGWVEYEDVFDAGYTHRLEFCHEICVKGHPSDPNCIFRYEIQNKHTASDSECFRKSKQRLVLPPGLSPITMSEYEQIMKTNPAHHSTGSDK